MIAIAKLLFALSFITSLLSLIGGGVVVPPFKTISWMVTPFTTSAIYGGCPRTEKFDQFFGLDEGWEESQDDCANLFREAPDISIRDEVRDQYRLNPPYEAVTFAFHFIGTAFVLAALFGVTRVNSMPGVIFAFASVVFQGIAFAIALSQFTQMARDLNEIPLIGDTFIGAAPYLCGGSLLATFIGAILLLGVSNSHNEKFGNWA